MFYVIIILIILILKKTKPIELLKIENYQETNIIFGHNRWRTHGEKSEINAFPHISNSKEIVLVHTEFLKNFSELKIFTEKFLFL